MDRQEGRVVRVHAISCAFQKGVATRLPHKVPSLRQTHKVNTMSDANVEGCILERLRYCVFSLKDFFPLYFDLKLSFKIWSRGRKGWKVTKVQTPYSC